MSAKQQIAAIKRAGQYPETGIEVVLRGGFYQLAGGMNIRQEDSGMEDAEVIYRAYGSEQVVVSNGIEIKRSEFQTAYDNRIRPEAAGKILKLNLSEKNIAPYEDLYCYGHSAYYLQQAGVINKVKTPNFICYNNEIMELAKYPNEGYINVSAVNRVGDMPRNWLDDIMNQADYVPPEERHSPPLGMIFSISDNRIQQWGQAEHAWLYGYWRYDWSDQAVPVSHIYADTRKIETALPSAYGIRADSAHQARFYIYNLLEELDSPGEWFYDVDSQDFFIYPLDDDPESVVSFSNSNNNIITLNQAEHIGFWGITFENSNSHGIGGNGNNIKIVGCRFKNISNSAISLSDSDELYIAHNTITGIGSNGIAVEGGNRINLTKTGNIVYQNTISDFAKINATGTGIYCGGVGNIIRNNTVFNSVGNGVKVSGNDHMIVDNEFYHLLQESSDNGVIYMGRSVVSRGNIMSGNYIHDIESSSLTGDTLYGIYLDDQFCGAVVKNNRISRITNGIGVFINGGRDNIVKNNVFEELSYSIRISCPGRATSWNGGTFDAAKFGVDGTIPYDGMAYAKYPHLANILEDEPLSPKYNMCMNNVSSQVTDEYLITLLAQYGSTMTEAEMLEKNTILMGNVY